MQKSGKLRRISKQWKLQLCQSEKHVQIHGSWWKINLTKSKKMVID